MSDAKFFARGKVQELRQELTEDVKKDPKNTKKRTVLKKIVANMTMGNDMSPLFPDVISCMQISDLEIKKMVYLYLINYAKTKPELVLMTINSFLKDVADSNPLIRALALRTMAYIQVDKVMDCICEPLRECLKDSDAYVRKTAAVCIPKIYFYSKELALREGLLDSLKALLADSNPTVIANAVAGLMEIHEKSDDFTFNIEPSNASTLITALNDCSEWSQNYIIESLLFVVPPTVADTESLIDRLTPRLQHANSGLVLSTVKVILYLLNYTEDEKYTASAVKKLAPPLVTLTSAEPEIQYVALRNILLILQKFPDILKGEMKVFFCKYNDPIYVKLSKLEIMFRLAHEGNVDIMLAELKEYATEVDVDFVRKSVRSIGRCAIKIEVSADKCIQTLVELIQTKVNYVVQEAIVVIRDIFRKYPNRYESIISVLCENLDNLDEPEAKASMIWIIGQYADRIENSAELLEGFIESFLEEPTEVQLALLSSTVKLFIKRPTQAKELVPKILKWATEEIDNPDVRDRGYIYWRLLSTDPVAAKAIVLADQLAISTETDNLDPVLLEELLLHINSLASIYHKPLRVLFGHIKPRRFMTLGSTLNLHNLAPLSSSRPNKLYANETSQQQQAAKMSAYNPYNNDLGGQSSKHGANMNNLLDLDLEPEPVAAHDASTYGYGNFQTQVAVSQPTPVLSTSMMDQLGQLGLGSSVGKDVIHLVSEGGFISQKQVLLSAGAAKGMEISGTFARRRGCITMEMTFTNKAMQPLSDFMIQFNKNTFGILPAAPLEVRSPLPANQSAETSLMLMVNPGHAQGSVPINNLHVAVKNNVGVFFFQTLVPIHVLFGEDGQLPQNEYLALWKEIEATAQTSPVDGFSFANIEAMRSKLHINNVFTIAERAIGDKFNLYLCSKTVDGNFYLVELQAPANAQTINVCVVQVRSQNSGVIQSYIDSLSQILQSR